MAKKPQKVSLPWDSIETVLLDMDGTLLDGNFDDRFWLEHVPRAYAAGRSIPLAAARKELFRTYAAQEGTLNWTDVDYWSRTLGLDIEGLKEDLGHLVALHPHAEEFLHALWQGRKEVWLVTNAHPKTLKFKMRRVDISNCFNGIITSQDIGFPKEQAAFWSGVGERIGFCRESTLCADDTEAVLVAAGAYGITHLVHISRYSTKRDPEPSERFPSIEGFHEIMP